MQQTQRCKFYNHKKKRPCAMEVYKPGLEFCAFHGTGVIEFVDCPLDPSHQVAQDKLKKHLKICNKLKSDKELKDNPFYQPKINNAIINDHHKTKLIDLQNNQPQQFQQLIDLIPNAFNKAIGVYSAYLNSIGIIQEGLQDYMLDNAADLTLLGISDNEKDLTQVQKLAQIMKDKDLVSSDFAYIEYGAGKGRFSHQVAEVIKEQLNGYACHLLIEREPRKLKFDRFHRENPYFMRCRMDITDFNLNILKQQLISKGYTKDVQYIGICKHMCGGATDLTLTSLLTQDTKPKGICIATCCHHLCDLDTYKNPQFLQLIGFDKQMSELMFQCSSWYVSGSISNINKEQPEKKVKIGDSFLDSKQRRQLGIMSKRIIDIGRVLHVYELTKCKTQLIKYCEQNLSPENYIIFTYQ